MKLVKRCNDPVIALLSILPALKFRFTFHNRFDHRFHPRTRRKSILPAIQKKLLDLEGESDVQRSG
jgi:hypothetical protein